MSLNRKKALRKNRREQRLRFDEPLSIAVIADPNFDVRPLSGLLKSAMLYADEVVLHSPIASFAAAYKDLSESDDATQLEVLLEIMRGLDRHTPEADQFMDGYIGLKRKKRRTPEQSALLNAIEKEFDLDTRPILQESAAKIMEESGLSEYEPAIRSGLLKVDGFGLEDFVTGDEIAESYANAARKILASRSTMPIFDTDSAKLIKAMLDKSGESLSSQQVEDMKEAGLAAGIIGRLPNVDSASLEELLQIRDALSEPLVRFRSTIVTTSRDMTAHSLEPDFESETRAIWRRDVAPELLDITKLLDDGRWHKTLWNELRPSMGKASATGTGLLLGSPVQMPLLTAGVALAAGTVLEAGHARKKLRQQVEKKPYYFIHQANARLPV